MMCWFYCIPFARGLFFALPLLLVIFSLLALKRGIRQSRPLLRQIAFLLIFGALLKALTVDLHMLRGFLLCETGWFPASACSAAGFKILQAAGLVLLVLGSFVLINLYRNFMDERVQAEATPEQVHLPFWANTSISLVVVLILWLAAPWVGYLTVGHVPQLFMHVPWQHLAVLNIAVLLVGFWKLEDCSWIYNSTEKGKKKHMTHVWTPKDTLWTSVILFLIAMAFSYASNDALSTSMSGGGHMQINPDSINLDKLGGGFRFRQQ